MNTRQLNPRQVDQVQQDIYALISQNPELAEDEILRADMIEAETDAFELLRQIEAARQDACGYAAGVATTIAGLDARLGRYERREQVLRELIKRIMDAADLRKVELPEATFSIRPSPPKVIITDDTEIPDSFFRTKRELMKEAVRVALREGVQVPGCHLSNQTDCLSIRTK